MSKMKLSRPSTTNSVGRKAANHQSVNEALHDANNAFVKSTQEHTKKLAGKAPKLPEEACDMNSYMCNNGKHAEELTRKITSSFEKEFPVK